MDSLFARNERVVCCFDTDQGPMALVLVGAMIALGIAENPTQQAIGFVAVLLAAGNAVGGYVVTERMLEMFKSSNKKDAGEKK